MADLRTAFFAMDSIISGPVYSTSMNPPGNMLSIRRSNNSLNDWDGVPKRADLHPLLTPYRSQFISKFIRLMFLSCTESQWFGQFSGGGRLNDAVITKGFVLGAIFRQGLAVG